MGITLREQNVNFPANSVKEISSNLIEKNQHFLELCENYLLEIS